MRAFKGELWKAIAEKCKECIYDPIGATGTWRQQVEACESKTCPLWPVRPLSASGQGGSIGEEEIGQEIGQDDDPSDPNQTMEEQ